MPLFLLLCTGRPYSWLGLPVITFEIFRNCFFWDRGVGGWGVSYPNFLFLYLHGPQVTHILTQPLCAHAGHMVGFIAKHRTDSCILHLLIIQQQLQKIPVEGYFYQLNGKGWEWWILRLRCQLGGGKPHLYKRTQLPLISTHFCMPWWPVTRPSLVKPF